MDLFTKAYEYETVRQAKEGGYYPYFIPLDRNEGTEVVYQGQRIIMCGSNNYLGLTTHPKVREAAIDAIKKYGTSCTGSRFLNGTLELHLELERRLAKFFLPRNKYVCINIYVYFCSGYFHHNGMSSHIAINSIVFLSFSTLVDSLSIVFSRFFTCFFSLIVASELFL